MADLKKQKILYLSIIVVLTVVIGYSCYYLLGGFDEREVIELGSVKRNIVGKPFTGYYAHPDLEDIWINARQLVKDGAIPGSLALVNFQVDSLDNDEVSQFIGIAIEGGMAEIPAGYEVMEIKMDNRLMIALTMHPLVRPSPSTIEEMLSSFANDRNVKLGDYTVELHFLDNSMVIEAPFVE